MKKTNVITEKQYNKLIKKKKITIIEYFQIMNFQKNAYNEMIEKIKNKEG